MVKGLVVVDSFDFGSFDLVAGPLDLVGFLDWVVSVQPLVGQPARVAADAARSGDRHSRPPIPPNERRQLLGITTVASWHAVCLAARHVIPSTNSCRQHCHDHSQNSSANVLAAP